MTGFKLRAALNQDICV